MAIKVENMCSQELPQTPTHRHSIQDTVETGMQGSGSI